MEMKWPWSVQAQTEKPDSLKGFLNKQALFSDLSWLELRRLELIVHERTYQPGEVVFYEGEPGVGMYIVRSGMIELVKEGPKKPSLAVFREGDFFGEVALLTELPRTATARAMESASLLGFFRPDLLNLLESQPKMGSKVLLRISQVVAQRLVQTLGAKSETRLGAEGDRP